MNSQEVWLIEVNDRIYEANFEEVVQWINEGAIQPDDKIKRGNLRWLEAGKVPLLYEHFQAAQLSEESSNSVINSNAESDQIFTNSQIENYQTGNKQNGSFVQVSVNKHAPSDINSGEASGVAPLNDNQFDLIACSIHTELEPVYICEICDNLFCKTCPNSFGSSVKLCPSCGGMCIPYTGQERNKEKITGAVNKPYKRNEKTINQTNESEAKLKIEDVRNALKYPFKFLPDYFIGSALLISLIIGLSLTALGGTAMHFATVGFAVAAMMLTFCVLAKIVENFTQKNFSNYFLPRLNKYNIWEDVIHPSLLSVGVYLISFGLFFAVTLGAGFYARYKVSNNLEDVEMEMRQTNDRVNSILKNSQKNLDDSNKNQNDPLTSNIDNPPVKTPHLDEIIKDRKENYTQSIFGENYLGDNQELEKLAISIMRLSVAFQMPILFTFIFGLFYFPAAGAIAGSTRSFVKTLNPFLGFKTIKKFGLDYFKIILTSLLFVGVSFAAATGFYLLFSGFNFKFAGILSAIIVGSLFTFYFWIVFSYLLGSAVYNQSVNASVSDL